MEPLFTRHTVVLRQLRWAGARKACRALVTQQDLLGNSPCLPDTVLKIGLGNEPGLSRAGSVMVMMMDDDDEADGGSGLMTKLTLSMRDARGRLTSGTVRQGSMGREGSTVCHEVGSWVRSNWE